MTQEKTSPPAKFMSLTEIVKVFPDLYHSISNIDCGPGWSLILYELSLVLSNLLKKCNTDSPNRPLVLEVKEKEGKLYFDMANPTAQMKNFIKQAEEASTVTCERCAGPGSPAKVNGLWMVRCRRCWDKEMGFKNER